LELFNNPKNIGEHKVFSMSFSDTFVEERAENTGDGVNNVH
jgi:hypothetical protein